MLSGLRRSLATFGRIASETGLGTNVGCAPAPAVSILSREVSNALHQSKERSLGGVGWYSACRETRSFCAIPGPSPLQQTPGGAQADPESDSVGAGGELARHVPLRSAHAVRRHVKISPKKLNLVAKVVRRLHVEDAVSQCDALPKKAARIVRSTISSACRNAVNNFKMNFGLLHIDECFVTQGQSLKRVWIHGRGRAGIRKRYYSHLTVVVKEKMDTKRKVKYQAAWIDRNEGRRGRGLGATFIARKIDPADLERE
ncbi:hypothetical protein BSKO_08104 [Bryopsis sp. KO-2023]|nr:hypothetical protein BSKO_08104 [Bryopsis sp. KO-2023]